MRYLYFSIVFWLCCFFSCSYCSLEQDILREKFFRALLWSETEHEALNILDKKWDYTVPDERHWTPLQIAVYHNRLTVIKKLLEKAVPVDAHDGSNNNAIGWTALHIATRSHYIQALNLLLQAHANIQARDGQGDSVLHYAIAVLNPKHMYKSDLINFYRKRDAKERATLAFLLSKGADINAQNNDGDTLLHKVVCAGRTSLVKFLLSYPTVNTSLKNKQGLTPFSCVYKKYPLLAVLLLRHKLLMLVLEQISSQLPQEIITQILTELLKP